MTKGIRPLALVMVLLALLAGGCDEAAPMPDPQALTRDAIGHYCNMIVADHPGPKAQVHERGNPQPLWFSSVRDAFVYLALAGEAQRPSAVYVHDMGRATNWDSPPDDGAWVPAKDAVYVINSRRRGGMGARETVPFSVQEHAVAFVDRFGGEIVAFDQIPRDYIIGDTGDHAANAEGTPPGQVPAGNRSWA